ncbi:MAG TPA: thioredoxin [Polyangiaceae bacterium]|jgi:hypothetical protein|nr:thioredoxin [Polyangiaceae bacterium]
MKRFVLLTIVLLACRTEAIGSDPAPQKSSSPTSTGATGLEGIGAKAAGVELIPAPPGDVAAIVKSARTEARKKHRALMVYIGAVWCEPCQHFHHAAEAGQLDAKFPNLTLLVFDLDNDGQRLRRAQYAPGYVPYFGVPGDDGHATSTAMEGSIKGEGAVDNISPRLVELVAKAQ